jgi:hypothetical protein
MRTQFDCTARHALQISRRRRTSHRVTTFLETQGRTGRMVKVDPIVIEKDAG